MAKLPYGAHHYLSNHCVNWPMQLASGNIRLLRPEPYDGQSPDIVIGIDVGTTFSGVSYAIRRPGEVPEIVSVSG